MKAVLAGADDYGFADALTAAGVDVTVAAGTGNRPALEEAGIVDADLLVLTEAGLATSISIAKDLNDDLYAVVYSDDSLPEFAAAQADLVVDPALLDPEAVAEELANG